MKNFKTGTFESIDCNGTHLQGYVDENYFKLKKVFGNPTSGDEYKVDAEWIIEFDDGEVVTIYNYKDGESYLGSEGTPKTKIRDWHIGGKTPDAVKRIETTLKNWKP